MSEILEGLSQGVTLRDVVEATYNDMSGEFQARIPAELLDDLSSFGNALANYEPGQNEFVYSLINHIGLVTVNYKNFNNPLKMFKRGKLEFGDTIEDVYVDVIKGILYDPEVPNSNAGDQWQTFKPNMDVVFHKINKALVYPITLNETIIRRAFKSYRELDKFLAGVMQQMYNADELDDFGLTCELLGSYASWDGKDGYYKVHVDAIDSEADAKAFVTKARAMVKGLRFPTRKYNAKGVMSWSRPEDLYLLVTPALTAYMDVNVLASAFNMGKAEFLGNVVEIPEIPVTNAVALLVDKEFFQIWDTEIRMATTGLNARHLTTNYFYHHQGIFSLSPFYNAIEFTTDTVVDPSAITITGDSSIAKGATKSYSATVTGGATGAVEWSIVGEPQYASINQNGNLTVGANFASETITIKAVSVEKSSVYATKEITVGSSARLKIEADTNFGEGVTTLLGATITKLQSDIEVTGTYVSGTSKYYDDNEWSGAGWSADEKDGNFLALHFDTVSGATTTVELIGGTHGVSTLDADGICIFRLTAVGQKIRVVSTKGLATTTKIYDLSGVVLEADAQNVSKAKKK